MTCSFVISGTARSPCDAVSHLAAPPLCPEIVTVLLGYSDMLVGGACCVHILGSHVQYTTLKMEAATSSETSVTKYQLAQVYSPEDFVMYMPLAQGYYFRQTVV